MFVESYIQTATVIFNEYALQLPLPEYLKKFFKVHPKFGSRDRRYIAELLYGLYRLGKQQSHLPVRERMLAGVFLSGSLPVLFFEKTDSFLASNYNKSFAEKKQLLTEKYGLLFQIDFELCEGISANEYFEYLFQTSKVFIRIRKNREKILSVLEQKEVAYTEISEHCISVPSNTKLHEVLQDKDEYVVQDYASQMTGAYLNPVNGESWWDCCAASGGKSLLLLDKNHQVDLTVSDIRAGIIENLHERFRQYHYKKYKAFIIDVSRKIKQDFLFDHIIADVPCSGAGTWSRSPEQYYFFDDTKLQAFHSLQSSILHNVLLHLKPGGTLYYFTCSIFKKENEEVIASLDTLKYTVTQQQLLKGFQYGGDCLFFCAVKKN